MMESININKGQTNLEPSKEHILPRTAEFCLCFHRSSPKNLRVGKTNKGQKITHQVISSFPNNVENITKNTTTYVDQQIAQPFARSL